MPAPRGGASSSEGATISNEVFNLVKNIVGAGILSLPAGIAAYGDAPSAVLPAAFLISFIGLSSAYCFSLIGRVCSATGAASYRDAWSKSVGSSTSWIPASACTFKTGVANVAYSMILASTFQSLFATAGLTIGRTSTLLLLTGTVLLPLCLLKNLAALAPFSLLGIAGVGFTSFSMLLRYLDGSYAPGGKFFATLAASKAPKFGAVGASGAASAKSTILLCMLSTAYLAHYNAPKYYAELRNPTVPRYNVVVASAFAASIALFSAVASIGFLTFGANSAGLILDNYSTADPLATMSRVAIATSIIFSYPLTFVGIREGVFDLMKVPVSDRTPGRVNRMSVVILAVVTGLALVLKDLSFVLSFGGATLGNAIVFLFPTMMFRALYKGKEGKGFERGICGGVAAFGVGMGIIGAKMALKGAGGH